MIELSPSAEIWCVYVTSINDGTQILTFLGIHNNRDFQNSRVFCGKLVILYPELHWFLFSDRFQSLHPFPELCTHSWVKIIAPKKYSCFTHNTHGGEPSSPVGVSTPSLNISRATARKFSVWVFYASLPPFHSRVQTLVFTARISMCFASVRAGVSVSLFTLSLDARMPAPCAFTNYNLTCMMHSALLCLFCVTC